MLQGGLGDACTMRIQYVPDESFLLSPHKHNNCHQRAIFMALDRKQMATSKVTSSQTHCNGLFSFFKEL